MYLFSSRWNNHFYGNEKLIISQCVESQRKTEDSIQKNKNVNSPGAFIDKLILPNNFFPNSYFLASLNTP